MIGGVPFGSANNAARINAGLDIIQVLGKHFGKSFPVFVDNAEAINIIIMVDCQIIALVVSADEQLKKEDFNE